MQLDEYAGCICGLVNGEHRCNPNYRSSAVTTTTETRPAGGYFTATVPSVFTENGKILTQEEAEKAGVAKRFNTGKLDWTLMPIDAMESELRVWSYGRKKYPRDDRDPNSNRVLGNWEKLWGEDTIPLSLACAMRHLTAMLKGEMVDQESGEYHAAHVRANMAPIIRYLNQKP